ncbi:MAG: radical SAM family heme chaperone HemW, partial [Bacteroidota bacterium]
GGGTPSILKINEIAEILDAIHRNYTVSKDPEITLEANPDDLVDPQSGTQGGSRTLFQEYRTIGINRLSIGIQSFFERDLRFMHRAHSSEQAKACLLGAKTYFENLSVDLIYGVPGMSGAQWRQNIATALSFGIPHISSYALTVEPKTALAHWIKEGTVPDVDDARAQEHFYMLKDILEDKGFVHYEISNFGKPGFFSRNNTAYWQQRNYVGIGPSAHSYDGSNRMWNSKNNSKYIKALKQDILPLEMENLSLTDRYNEYVMTGLRTLWGVSLDKIGAEFGFRYQEYLMAQAQKHIAQHLLFWDGDVLRTTRKGTFFVDGLASDLFMLNLS